MYFKSDPVHHFCYWLEYPLVLPLILFGLPKKKLGLQPYDDHIGFDGLNELGFIQVDSCGCTQSKIKKKLEKIFKTQKWRQERSIFHSDKKHKKRSESEKKQNCS